MTSSNAGSFPAGKSENNTLAKAIERGDRHAITTALKSGKAQIKKR
jgi:hypothetical protein